MLRRFKDDVSEVRSGMECGVTIENYSDLKPGDIIETFELETVLRKLEISKPQPVRVNIFNQTYTVVTAGDPRRSAAVFSALPFYPADVAGSGQRGGAISFGL